MKYFSELTKTLFNSEAELKAEEERIKKAQEVKAKAEEAKKTERAKRAKEVEEAIKKANNAKNEAFALLQKFTKDYGHFHMTYSSDNLDLLNDLDVLDLFLKDIFK